MYLDINLGRAIAKFFKGKREDITDYIKANNLLRDMTKFKSSDDPSIFYSIHFITIIRV